MQNVRKHISKALTETLRVGSAINKEVCDLSYAKYNGEVSETEYEWRYSCLKAEHDNAMRVAECLKEALARIPA